MEVIMHFYSLAEISDAELKYAVIVSRHNQKWVLCKQKSKNTWEIPGGTREPNEDILATANRELYEETGALDYELIPVCVYSAEKIVAENNSSKSYGLLCYADIKTFSDLPESEMECIDFFEELPTNLTWPSMHPPLLNHVKQWLKEK